MSSQSIALDSPLEPRPPGCLIPLTALQARRWNSSLKADGTRPHLRMCVTVVRVLGPLSLSLLQRSIEVVIGRHEALHTRIVMKGGTPYQQIEPTPPYVLSCIDLSDQQPRASSEASRLVQKFIDTPVDRVTAPPFEAKVWKLGDCEHVLVMLIDNLFSDGTSNGIISREVWECYRQGDLSQPDPAILPPVRLQFPDYAVWQAQTHLHWMEKHAEYWRQYLSGARPTAIPEDRCLSEEKPATGTTKHIPFGEELTVALRDTARRERSLLSVITLVAYAIVLSAWCKTGDLLVALASHGRHQQALRNTVGYVANYLLLRIKIKREQTLGELIAQVKHDMAAAFAHRDFDRLPDFLPEYTTEVVFNWQATHSKQGPLDHHVMFECADQLVCPSEAGLAAQIEKTHATNQIRILPFPARTPDLVKFGAVFFDTPSGIHMTVTFDPSILAPRTIDLFHRCLLMVAKEICQCPAPSIASLLAKVSSVWCEERAQ